ncbi:MAG TPA: hypothetical protein VMN39_09995, partial [Longimicrobiaceae bacterium]|nr:hypothetical protein [Longimicrobiaceae bacterium]
MPEYLAPGVYMEEVSFRSKSIEGVPTSTTGYVGPTRYGPVRYNGGPRATEPRLVTSFTEYEQVFGGLQNLDLQDAEEVEQIGYLAHAARMFFLNGGKRLYVSRVFTGRGVGDDGVAQSDAIAVTGYPSARWRARWPGAYGNSAIAVTPMRTKVAPYTHPIHGSTQVRGVRHGSVLEVRTAGNVPVLDSLPDLAEMMVVHVQEDGEQIFHGDGGVATIGLTDVVNLIEMKVAVVAPTGDREDVYTSLAGHPGQIRYVGKILDAEDPEDENALVALRYTPPGDAGNEFAAALLTRAL